jgi:hypothetical protein
MDKHLVPLSIDCSKHPEGYSWYGLLCFNFLYSHLNHLQCCRLSTACIIFQWSVIILELLMQLTWSESCFVCQTLPNLSALFLLPVFLVASNTWCWPSSLQYLMLAPLWKFLCIVFSSGTYYTCLNRNWTVLLYMKIHSTMSLFHSVTELFIAVAYL